MTTGVGPEPPEPDGLDPVPEPDGDDDDPASSVTTRLPSSDLSLLKTPYKNVEMSAITSKSGRSWAAVVA